MKILFKLLILTISLVLIIALTIYGARTGYLNTPINYALEYYLQLKNFNATINHLTLKNDQIKIDSITLSQNGIKFRLDNIILTYNLDLNYKKSKIVADVTIDKTTAQDSDNKEFFSTKINFSYNNYFVKRKSNAELNLDNISYQDLFNSINLEEGKAIINHSFSSRNSQYYINVIFNDNVTLNLQGRIDNNISFTGNVKNVPIAIYKPFHYLHPKNDLLIFLNKFIKAGIIESSEFNINISEKDLQNNNYTKENINGFTKISNLKFTYNDDLPPLTNMQIDLSQKGMISEFIINKANSTDILISNGLIYMDWKGQENTKLLITAKAQGPTRALTDFISINTHKALSQASIDLKKLTGDTNIDIFKIQFRVPPK